MCTLAVAIQTDRRWPLVVAANRDERLDRAAESWAPRQKAGGRHLAPRDLEAGGTWIGLSASGLLAAVTNYHAPLEWYPDPKRRSRGELVERALAYPSAERALVALSPLEATAWNPFHLVVADAHSAFLWRYDGESSAVTSLGDGLHIVTESSADGSGPRGDWIRAHWPIDLEIPGLRQVLIHHAEGSYSPTCIHAAPHYGTRSSTILRLARSLAHSELYVADGPPCTTPFENRSRLLSSLAQSA